MKLLIAACLVAIASAAPPPRVSYPTDNVQLISYENETPGLGNYKFGFKQSDGTEVEQKGEIVNEGREDESIAVSGYFSWFGPDGVLYTVHYKANDDGYQPEIEQGPGGGVPPAVVASLLGK